MKTAKDKQGNQWISDDDDFGEGEIEDTQDIKTGGGFTYFSQGPKGSSTSGHKKDGSRLSTKHGTGMKIDNSLPPFNSIYDKKMIDSYPQRTRWEIPESKIVFSSQFCSGNLSRA